MRPAFVVVRACLLAAVLVGCGGGAAVVRPGPSAPPEATCWICHPSSEGPCLETGHCRGDQAQCEAIGCVTVRTAPGPCREIPSYCEPASAASSPPVTIPAPAPAPPPPTPSSLEPS